MADNRLPVLFMTKEVKGREDVAFRTIRAARAYVTRTGHLSADFSWYVAYGGGSTEYLNRLKDTFSDDPVKIFYEEGATAGRIWNIAVQAIFNDGNAYYLRLEDDFQLKGLQFQPMLNLSPFEVVVIDETQNVGMVRLGLMPVGLEMRSRAYQDEIYFEILSDTQYMYSGHPGIVHRRLHEAVGFFAEDKNPGEIELDFDGRLRKIAAEGLAPEIWWPMSMARYGTWGAWDHIGTVQSY